jgi:4'-phosphopantetheinyl transferase
MVSVCERPAAARSAAPDVLRAPALEHGDVHVWAATLEHAETLAQRFLTVLTEDERERASRFRFPVDAARFSAARAILRLLLGAYAGSVPEALRFGAGPHGKPFLSSPYSGGLRFNVSHSGTWALYAFARGRELGVDIEDHRSTEVDLGVADHFFSRREVAALRVLPAAERAGAFLRCWTRKEAFVKARGTGLTTPLDAFDVSLERGCDDALLAARGAASDGRRWAIRELGAALPECSAAIAAEGDDWRLRVFRAPRTLTDTEAWQTTQEKS